MHQVGASRDLVRFGFKAAAERFKLACQFEAGDTLRQAETTLRLNPQVVRPAPRIVVTVYGSDREKKQAQKRLFFS
jgi:hypothetical protein